MDLEHLKGLNIHVDYFKNVITGEEYVKIRSYVMRGGRRVKLGLLVPTPEGTPDDTVVENVSKGLAGLVSAVLGVPNPLHQPEAMVVEEGATYPTVYPKI